MTWVFFSLIILNKAVCTRDKSLGQEENNNYVVD